ncbi:DUF3311 domain-containing protein [Acetobacter malorum]|mgnify:CR=1 FL=1|uniref:DUF3311 domain-containing protein n=1 Tax=Acetobacter malorum TaxID=178901 RepID=UPI00248D4DD9|nr:DUF3311 domain-containing protein [Acetobacter malorum]
MRTLPNRRAVALGFGIPCIAIVLVAPFLSRLTFSLFGIPIVFIWLFAWFPLTSLCLWLCERLR